MASTLIIIIICYVLGHVQYKLETSERRTRRTR